MRILASIALALAPLLVAAQEPDIPGRVGRIAHIEGSAAVYQDPDQGWDKAYVNTPFTSENSVWTDPGSRAELRVGSTAIRLDETTQIDISRLDDEQLDAFIPRGTVAVRVRHFDRAFRLRFDTPYARFSLRADGRYRIDVDPDREESRITVLTGDARVGSESGNLRAGPGQTVRVFGGDSPSYVVEAALRDPFDQWSAARDARWAETNAPRYVSTEMTGYEDLDNYGQWANEPEYGALWYPTQVAVGWAPYRHGHWGYVRPWGWTWIDDAPWGYAPFHYGRWVYIRDRWAWHPGVREAHPVWAPALVAWVGGVGISVGVSAPSVGWYPLSPWDRYQPWYRASPTYVNRVNVVVINTPPRAEAVQWRNFTRDQGVTVVNRDVVVDRRPVQAALVTRSPGSVMRDVQVSTPAALLPPRAEVIQRQAVLRNEAVARGQSLPGAAPNVSSGVRVAPAPRPEFGRSLPAAAAATPQLATTPAPAAQRVTPGPTIQRPGPQPSAQELQEQQVARQRAEAQRAARGAQPQQQPQQRMQQQPQSLPQQQEQQQQARQRAEEQRAAREAQQRQQQQPTPQQREQLQQQQQQEAQQARQRAEEQRAAREAQQRQQQQQQQRVQQQQQQQLQQRQEQQHAQPQAQPQARPRAEPQPQPQAKPRAEPQPAPQRDKSKEEEEKKKKEEEKRQR